mgnify:CR=1 FL=1
MKKHLAWGVAYWILSILVKGLIIMGGWNLIVVNIFDVKNITYLISLGIALVLSLFTRRRYFHRDNVYHTTDV